MDKFDEYKYLLGETIMLYQFMENDLKLIYAGLLGGTFYKNIEYVRSTFKGLGQIVIALEELDNVGNDPYFSADIYAMLHKLARQRNYYCHQCCMEFCYNPYFRESFEFSDSYDKLVQTNSNVKTIQKQTEKHRQEILAQYQGL